MPVLIGGEQVLRDLHFVYSLEGPPYVELIGADEPPWDLRDGLHHMGIWTEDVVADMEALVAQDYTVSATGVTRSGRSGVFAYLNSPTGGAARARRRARTGVLLPVVGRRRVLLMADEPTVPLLAQRLRRYCFAYTASHDPSMCDDILVEDYALHVGEFEICGRDENYKPAALKQYRQFPGLGMSVHDLLVTPQRAALLFSEYGRSVLTGTAAAWNGISMYHWDGDRLTDCRVEQDYYSRRAQLRSGRPNPIAGPAHDPWMVDVEEPDAGVETAAREWLAAGGIARLPAGALDDEPVAAAARIELGAPAVEVLDCFVGAARAASHATATGTITAWPGAPEHVVGQQARVYYAGIAHLRDGSVTGARVISDRLAVERRLSARS